MTRKKIEPKDTENLELEKTKIWSLMWYTLDFDLKKKKNPREGHLRFSIFTATFMTGWERLNP